MAKGRKKGRKTVWRKREIDTSAPTAAGGGDCCETSAPTAAAGDDCCETSAPSAAAGDDCCHLRDNNKETSTNTIVTYNEKMSPEEYDGPDRRLGRMAVHLEPKHRQSHMAARLEHYVVMFGGMDFSFEVLPCDVIWLYNLYTEMWSKHVLSCKASTPGTMYDACAVEINKAIYMFGGETKKYSQSNAIWKLARTKKGGFAWREIERTSKKSSERKPSPRSKHTAWAFDNKLWIFGGLRYSDIVLGNGRFEDFKYSNQLFFFDTSCDEWTHPKCTGQIPPPSCNRATAVVANKVWLFGGDNDLSHCSHCVHLLELDMISLTWTIIDAGSGFKKPQSYIECSLIAVTEDTLLLHSLRCATFQGTLYHTWILDLSSMSWRCCEMKLWRGYPRMRYRSCIGINSDIIVLGGYWQEDLLEEYWPEDLLGGKWKENVVAHVKQLEPRSLQHLAMKIVYEHHNVLPWKQCLPTKLTALLDIPG